MGCRSTRHPCHSPTPRRSERQPLADAAATGATEEVKTAMNADRPSMQILFCVTALASACSRSHVDAEVSAPPQLDGPEMTREAAQRILRDAQAIPTPRGIEDLEAVEIGGIPQWISVRGRDRRNPILLFIHGGPGTTEMPVSWYWQRPVEDFFTVVQWDQRGCGKTAASTPESAALPTITLERMIADGGEMVAHLRAQYGKDKIFVLGHSWGTLIGLELAKRHPNWLHAYVGMGQFIYTRDNEAVGYRFALREARRRNDETAIRELEAIAPYPSDDMLLPLPSVIIQRKWVAAYGGMTWGRADLAHEENLRRLSPEYSDADLAADDRIVGVVARLLPQLGRVDYRGTTRLDLPVFLFSGRHDYAVPSEVSLAWFERLDAPLKQIVWFEHAAHMMHLEEPGQFILHLVQDVRPIAAAVGDAAPPDAPGTGR